MVFAEPIHVLLVEDNDLDVELTRHAMEDWRVPAQVHVVEHGGQALSFLAREGAYVDAPRPDVILLDLHMPILDGQETLSRIRSDERLRSIPLYVLTGLGCPTKFAGMPKLPADGYLTKPIDVGQLETLLLARRPALLPGDNASDVPPSPFDNFDDLPTQ